jgi:hypothetical protein
MFIGRKGFALSFLLAAAVLLPSVTLGQNTIAANRDWSALKTVAFGSKLVIKLKDGKTVAGKLSSVSDGALSLSVKSKSVNLDRPNVLSVYQVTKKSATKATVIGLGLGAGAGAAIGAAGSANDNSGFEKIDHAVTAGLTVLGAAAGALTGYFIGRGSSKRVLIYEAP